MLFFNDVNRGWRSAMFENVIKYSTKLQKIISKYKNTMAQFLHK